MSKTRRTQPLKRFSVEVESGRAFIVYAADREGAILRLMAAKEAGAIVYDAAGPVPLKTVGAVIDVQELTGPIEGKVLVDT